MTTEKKPVSINDDIDLLLVIERLLLFLKKNKWIYITAIVLGIATGIFFYVSIPKTYKSRMVVHSFMLANQEEIQLLGGWNKLLSKKGYSELAGIFNCNESLLRKVKKIKGDEILQVFSSVNPNGFTIDVIVTDNNILDSLEKSIIYGFENSDYVAERLAVKRKNLHELIITTESEIQKLDSNKRLMTAILKGQERAPASLIVDISNINRQLIEMSEKLMSFKENLRFTNAVQVLQGFSQFNRPNGPKLIPWLIIGLTGFLGLAFAITFLRCINERLRLRRMYSNQ